MKNYDDIFIKQPYRDSDQLIKALTYLTYMGGVAGKRPVFLTLPNFFKPAEDSLNLESALMKKRMLQFIDEMKNDSSFKPLINCNYKELIDILYAGGFKTSLNYDTYSKYKKDGSACGTELYNLCFSYLESYYIFNNLKNKNNLKFKDEKTKILTTKVSKLFEKRMLNLEKGYQTFGYNRKHEQYISDLEELKNDLLSINESQLDNYIIKQTRQFKIKKL